MVPNVLDPYLPYMPSFMLVLFRMSGIFIFSPVFGSRLVPTQVRVLLAFALALCVFPVLPSQRPIALDLLTLPILVGTELMIGYIIGYGANLPLLAIQYGGMMMGQQMGLGLARVLNPEFEGQTGVLGQLLFMMAMSTFLMLNGHHLMLATLIRSFHAVPLGGFTPTAGVVDLLLGLLSSMIDVGMRVSAPVLCLVFMETVALGFVSRTVPQLNILSLGFPIRIMVGLLFMMPVVTLTQDVYIDAVNDSMSSLWDAFAPLLTKP